MGTWGTGLFSDDVACDIRDHYRALVEDRVDDAAATRSTLEKYRDYFEESGGGPASRRARRARKNTKKTL